MVSKFTKFKMNIQGEFMVEVNMMDAREIMLISVGSDMDRKVRGPCGYVRGSMSGK